MAQSYEELKPIVRPTGVHRGTMKFDADKCTSCGLCIDNCVFRCLEMDENDIPRMKEGNVCFSCFNCMVACPVEAVSIVESYHVDGGFYDTEFPKTTMPLEPEDAEGNSAQWTEIERLIFERRSIRNFKDKPVPDTLIRRVLESGRFAPSAGNNQPWKFTVITDKTLINEVEESCWAVWDNVHKSYTNDDTVEALVKSFGEPVQAGIFDPRVMGGVGCVSSRDLPIFVNAPVLILMGGNDKMIGPDMQVGIAGQNMNLAALSLGLGFCWIGFSIAINFIPELKSKLGFDDPWRVQSAAVLGYPKFKQQGLVPRQNRPVTWFRPESG